MDRPRPALRYMGGKWNLGRWIVDHFPNHKHYVEPFGGGANVLLQKEPSDLETYNDLYADVVNFFRILRDTPDRLVEQILFTPWAREEYRLSYEPADEALERARRFYVRCWQGIDPNNLTGWRHFKASGKGKYLQPTPEHLKYVAYRLRNVQFENRDALEVLESFDRTDTLFYVDPPYPASTRKRKPTDSYALEFDQHEELLENLVGRKGMVVLSTYDNELYEAVLTRHGWTKSQKRSKANNKSHTAVEALWLSPRVTEWQERRAA